MVSSLPEREILRVTKQIGVLTSGGDCAGLNATIRAVVLRAHHGYGWTVVGVRHGTLGLLERPVRMVAWWNRRLIDVPLKTVAGHPHAVDADGALVNTARALGICLGDMPGQQ